MGKKGYVGNNSPSQAEDLDEEPESQNNQSGYADKANEEKDKDQSEYPRARKEEQIAAQDAADGSAGPDHGGGRARVGKDLSQPCAETANQVKKEEAKMAEGIFYVISENPEVKHIPEQVKKTTVEEHRGKKSQRKWNGRNCLNNLSTDDLVWDGPPLKNEALTCGKIQSDLMVKNKPVGQDNSDGNEGERRNGVIVFYREKHGWIPLALLPHMVKM